MITTTEQYQRAQEELRQLEEQLHPTFESRMPEPLIFHAQG